MNKQEQKIEKFFEQSIYTGALNISVLKNQNGEYFLFGKYLIKPLDGLYSVMYEDEKSTTFSSLKIAVTWCVFHDKKYIFECKQIEDVDFKLSGIKIDIIQHTKILDNSKNKEVRMLYYSKLENDDNKQKMLIEKLNKYISMSKRWQNSRYNNVKPTNKR